MPSPTAAAAIERVRDSFGRQAIMATIGATLEAVSEGAVSIALPYRDDLTQQHGYLHAGVVATILDSACGYAAFSLMPEGAEVLSVEFKINLMAPASGERLLARGEVVRAGRTLTVTRGEAVAIRDGAEHPIATMQATMMCLRPAAGASR